MPARQEGRARAWLLAALVALVVVGLDQLTNHLVDSRNRGVAFGILPGHPAIVTILICVALLFLLAYFARHSAWRLMWLPTGLLIGGALGNIIDRARHGSVTDFIKLPLGWPPFNLADAAITLGILLLFALVDDARRN